MEFYHGKNHHMWSYCIPLGQYTSKDGRKYDLGVFIEEQSVSFAIVYGKKGNEYMSGDIIFHKKDYNEVGQETIKRYKEYLIKDNQQG